MGCCGSSSTYGIDVEQIQSNYETLRSKYGSDILIMSVKDQNLPGKLCMAGNVEANMADAITQCLKSDQNNTSVTMEKDKYDQMWSHVWRDTSITSGHSTFSLAKSYFPRGRLMVSLLDTIASFGWGLSAAPNLGGVEDRDDKGNVTSTVDWPVFIFYKEKESDYTGKHLFIAVKDSNIPGKTCVAGPVGDLENRVVSALKQFTSDVKSEKDSYDDDYDVVWRNTSITTGMQNFSFGKAYFPKGKTNIALLECIYGAGWRCVAAPNFGGKGDSWPCYVLRQLKDPGAAPELLFASIKDSNIPGKLCVSGKYADRMVDAFCGALSKVTDNAGVKNEKDSYDEDHDAVVRDCHITTGAQVFSFGKKYFPRGDSMKAVLDLMTAEGFKVVACPNFGGMLDSWPTFVMEKCDTAPSAMYLAIKDDNYVGKVDLVGGQVGNDTALAGELLDVFTVLCGDSVSQEKDGYDDTYELCYRNTVLTTGKAPFTFSKPWWPHGYVLEMMLQVLYKKGFKATGGPNFGDDGNSWPGIVFYKDGA